ncbi:hypothetical protein CSA56_10440 [candidate division KSB3 bacterium]|uniref:Histidine kinase/HSP90-like ATPase domain-containing protein n=1 Tax=candidate division KSB3 bacterium TaxID=2044937 RepID=A0A2G6KDN5_9BACT|nr:MAG: hypothetical protein CSA56_10440 [candidate division KSB3 bacterium]
MREVRSKFEATLDSLELIRHFVAEFMAKAHLPDDQINNFEVAVDEHISNLVEHAFQNLPGKTVTVTCRDERSKSQVIIADKSEGFDPRNYSIPDVEDAAIYEMPPGGFGNYFIFELMDEVEYLHRPFVKNELILAVYKHQADQVV